MIRLFKQNTDLDAYDIQTNGSIVIKPLKAVVHQAENGEFYLELETSFDYYEELSYGYQLVVDYLGDYEIFRVGAVTATRTKLSVKCPHITYDTDFRFWYDDWRIPGTMPPRVIGDRVIDVTDLNQCLDFIYSGVQTEGNATVCFGRKRRIDLDLTAYPVSQTSISITNGCSMSEMANTLIKDFGGFIYRKKYSFKVIPDRITNDTNGVIRYGDNLKSLSVSRIDSDYAEGILAIGNGTDLSNSSGALTPYGDEDGFMARRVKFDQSNILAEKYATQYAYRAALKSDLDARATAYLSENGVQKRSYNVTALIDSVTKLWDQVQIKDSKLGVNIKATVIAFEYDLILETFNQITFGNYTNSMTGYNAKLNAEIYSVRKDIPLKSYPIGSVITWTNSLVDSPNKVNSGFEGYWTSLGNDQWQRIQ